MVPSAQAVCLQQGVSTESVLIKRIDVCTKLLRSTHKDKLGKSCLFLQARQVRQSAAQNLGELTKMSMRVDQLAGDLTTNAKTAEPALRESYLTALCGMLASVGGRISPQVLSTTGATLQELMAATGVQHLHACLSSGKQALTRLKTLRITAACPQSSSDWVSLQPSVCKLS